MDKATTADLSLQQYKSLCDRFVKTNLQAILVDIVHDSTETNTLTHRSMSIHYSLPSTLYTLRMYVVYEVTIAIDKRIK